MNIPEYDRIWLEEGPKAAKLFMRRETAPFINFMKFLSSLFLYGFLFFALVVSAAIAVGVQELEWSTVWLLLVGGATGFFAPFAFIYLVYLPSILIRYWLYQRKIE